MFKVEGRVLISYSAMPNLRKVDGHPVGWLPIVWEDKHVCSNTYATHGYSKEDAMVIARERAREIGARFIGDWDVVYSDLPPKLLNAGPNPPA